MLIPGAIYDADTLSINTHRKNSINLQQNGIYMWHRVQTGGYEYTQRMWDNFLKKTQQKGSQWPCTFSSSPPPSSHIWNMCYATLAKKKRRKEKKWAERIWPKPEGMQHHMCMVRYPFCMRTALLSNILVLYIDGRDAFACARDSCD